MNKQRYSPAPEWNIPYLLHGYQEVRHVRCIKTEASELQALTTITLPPGTERDSRNEQFSISLQNAEDMSDEVLAATWKNYLDQFNYDANDAVDEWWLMGKFMMDDNGNGDV
ncbi:hypothetical protein B0H14DRAFT_2612408 [Mycena olivaceomarginata]|nr:hypothetical protein B0H14DRAFT_2612408 [Mycena olivaceomarginata]